MITSSNLKLIRQELLEGKMTLYNLVQAYLENIKNTKSNNAYVEVFEKEALDKAKALDDKLKNDPDNLGLLFGAVISIKDNLCYKDHLVTAGSKMLDGFMSPYDATAIERMIYADAIIIGRTNCDEFSMGSTSETSIYGHVKNAIDKDRVAGGSTGGGAVSVKDNTCIAAIGSDTGGSVRQPASFNGVIGYKPSYGLISRWGLIAYGSSFDVIGVIGKDIETIALITDVISGPDEYDSTAIQDPAPSFRLDDIDTGDKKVAYLTDLIDHPNLKDYVKKSFQSFVKTLEDQGIQVSEKDFEYSDLLVPTYYILCTAEASSNLSRFDGVRYGHRAEGQFEDFKTMIQQSRSEGFGYEVKKRIILGNYVLSEGYYDAYFKKALKVRQLIKQHIELILEQYDFIILPTTTSEAWHIGESSKDPIEMYLSDMFTVLANLCGIPSVSIPLTNNDTKMPLGIQIMSKTGNDVELLKFINSLSSS